MSVAIDPSGPAWGAEGDTSGAVTRVVLIADIAVIEAWQVREALIESNVKRCRAGYAAGAAVPPIELADVGGGLYLVDGWHRLEALRRLERADVEATIVQRSFHDAENRAAQANRNRGQRLTAREDRAAFGKFIATKQHRPAGRKALSYREIAAAFGGLSYGTARTWIKEGHPKLYAKMRAKQSGAFSPEPYLAKAATTADATIFNEARAAVAQAVALARGITDATLRAKLGLIARDAAKRIEQRSPVTVAPRADKVTAIASDF